jgi:hypothetical protein
MSYHVYIAFKGFKETPISLEAWLAAARQCEDVAVIEERNRSGKVIYQVKLKGDESASLHHTPYGLVDAQDPSKALVATMFNLAGRLGADVYSERLKRYTSIEDWEKRTRDYRLKRDERRRLMKTQRIRRTAMYTFVVVLSLALGWLTSRHAQ